MSDRDTRDWFYTAAEVTSACWALQQSFSSHIERFESTQPTHDGRTLQGLRVGAKNVTSTTKPVFMIIGGAHGNEWGSGEITLNLAADLAEGRSAGLDYGAITFGAAQIDAALQALDVVLVPLVNPDGYHHSMVNGESWRKNRSRVDEINGDPQTIGVDLNRNYPTGFATTGIAPSSPFYPGAGAVTEPETAYVAQLVEDWAPRWFVDLHTGDFGLIHPWSCAVPPQAMPAADVQAHLALGGIYANVIAAFGGPLPTIGKGQGFTVAGGTSHDWVYSRHLAPRSLAPRALAFSIEWSLEQVPLWHDMNGLVAQVSAGLVAMILAVAQGA